VREISDRRRSGRKQRHFLEELKKETPAGGETRGPKGKKSGLLRDVVQYVRKWVAPAGGAGRGKRILRGEPPWTSSRPMFQEGKEGGPKGELSVGPEIYAHTESRT